VALQGHASADGPVRPPLSGRGNTFRCNHNINPAARPADTAKECMMKHLDDITQWLYEGFRAGNDLPRLGPVPTLIEIIAHYGPLTGTGELVVHDVPGQPDPHVSRPNCAPAYYQGRPASVWINSMEPRRTHQSQDTTTQSGPAGGVRPGPHAVAVAGLAPNRVNRRHAEKRRHHALARVRRSPPEVRKEDDPL
jgi:hypothetical protein